MADVNLDSSKTTNIIGMAWADDVSFEDIKRKTGLSEADVIRLMRTELKPSSFRLWRKRVSGRLSKHAKKQKFKNQSQQQESEDDEKT
jgi:uncharacterized protein (TIGR03643 family)